MKNIRAFIKPFLVICATSIISGCATTKPQQYTPVDGMSEIEQKQPSPTDGMNDIEKIGYYLGWFSLDVLYNSAGDHEFYWP